MLRALVLAIGICALLPGLAAAKPKVAIVAFDGDSKKGEAREMVADTLGDDVAVLGSKQVNRTIDDLGFDTSALEDKQLRKLAKELDADAIVLATVSTKGKDKILHFKLFVHGKRVKGFKVELGSFKSPKVRAKLHDKLLEKLGFGTGAGDDDDSAAAAAPEPTPPPAPAKGKKKPPAPAGDDDDAAPPANATKKVPIDKHTGDDDDAAALKTAGSGDAAPAPHKRVAHAGDDDDDGASVTAHVEVGAGSSGWGGVHTANRDAVRVDVGPSASQRNLSFNSRDFPQAPKGYSNTIVPGARVDGEIYPFAFGDPSSIISGLGIGGLFDQTLALNLQTTIQPGTKFPVTQRHWGVGPRFRIAFGHKETSPTLVVGVNYGHRSFVVNRGALMPGNTLDIPDVDYRGFDPNVELRIPFTPRLALSFGGGAILLTGAGAVQTQEQYGQAKITGGEGNLAFDILFTPRLGVTIQVEAAQLGYTFKGNGEMTNDRDGDPSSQDVGGAADRYIGAAAMFAVIY